MAQSPVGKGCGMCQLINISPCMTSRSSRIIGRRLRHTSYITPQPTSRWRVEHIPSPPNLMRRKIEVLIPQIRPPRRRKPLYDITSTQDGTLVPTGTNTQNHATGKQKFSYGCYLPLRPPSASSDPTCPPVHSQLSGFFQLSDWSAHHQ